MTLIAPIASRISSLLRVVLAMVVLSVNAPQGAWGV